MGMHAEDLPGFEWMFDGPTIKASTDKEWREYYERKARESFKEEMRLKEEIRNLVAVARKHGLNGVIDSKILLEFFDNELQKKKKLQDSIYQVDDVLMVNWVGPRKDGDYRKSLNDLIDYNIKIHDDTCVSKEAQAKVDELCDLHLEIATLKNKLERAESNALGF